MNIKMTDGSMLESNMTIDEFVGVINKGGQFVQVNDKRLLINVNNIVYLRNYEFDQERYPVRDDEQEVTYMESEPYTAEEVKEDDRNFRLE